MLVCRCAAQLFDKNMNEQNLKVLITLQLCCSDCVSCCWRERARVQSSYVIPLFFPSFSYLFSLILFLIFSLFLFCSSFSPFLYPPFLFFLFSTSFFLPPTHYLSCLPGIEQNIQNINGCHYGCGQKHHSALDNPGHIQSKNEVTPLEVRSAKTQVSKI